VEPPLEREIPQRENWGEEKKMGPRTQKILKGNPKLIKPRGKQKPANSKNQKG